MTRDKIYKILTMDMFIRHILSKKDELMISVPAKEADGGRELPHHHPVQDESRHGEADRAGGSPCRRGKSEITIYTPTICIVQGE